MGFCFHLKSVAFTEDLLFNKSKKYKTASELYNDLDEAYENNTACCWLAAMMYVFVFLFSYIQFCHNRNRY